MLHSTCSCIDLSGTASREKHCSTSKRLLHGVAFGHEAMHVLRYLLLSLLHVPDPCMSCQVSHDYFENAMAFFTKTIYKAIMLSVSGGDISPLVGHNAFLRWAHMKECAFQGADGQTKYWSDAHVSEDFDIAIRFQVINSAYGSFLTTPELSHGVKQGLVNMLCCKPNGSQ